MIDPRLFQYQKEKGYRQTKCFPLIKKPLVGLLANFLFVTELNLWQRIAGGIRFLYMFVSGNSCQPQKPMVQPPDEPCEDILIDFGGL